MNRYKRYRWEHMRGYVGHDVFVRDFPTDNTCVVFKELDHQNVQLVTLIHAMNMTCILKLSGDWTMRSGHSKTNGEGKQDHYKGYLRIEYFFEREEDCFLFRLVHA